MIVMKFGGTSVEDEAAIRRLAAIVRREIASSPIVVVSAMGKTTNLLLESARCAAAGRLDQAEGQLELIAAHHDGAARALALPAEIDHLRSSLDEIFTALRGQFAAIARAGAIAPRASDAVAAQGELLSSLIVEAALRAEGIDAVRTDIRPYLRTNDDFTRAAVEFDETDRLLGEAFSAALAGGRVPVTQGFIGSSADGSTTTIGRGGSDYSAAIIGAALGAREIQIWTDVDGIMTTDPRIIPDAAKVRTISFAEAAELAYFGAKVLHPSTLLPAMSKGIPVRVCNSRRPGAIGTSIVRQAPRSSAIVKAIAFKRGITIINVASDRMLLAYGFLAQLFEIFARHETAVDMVATSEVSVSVTLDETRRLEEIVAEVNRLGEVRVEREKAIVCLVGEGLKYTPGVAARIFGSIAGINVSMISHGASAINVSFIVDDCQVEDAVGALHREFFSALDEETFESSALAQAG
jgi:aspartate kinase